LRFFGEELRLAREERGMSLRDVGAETNYSFQQIANVEAARRTPSAALARGVDRVMGTGDRFWRIVQRVWVDPSPIWFTDAAQEEEQAREIRIYEARVVPALLQVEEYTRARLQWAQPRTPPGEVDAVVADLAGRRAVLAREKPPFLWVILDESVLRRPIGGPDVMARQLEHLAHAAELPDVLIQVVPLDTPGHAGLDGSFTIWAYPDRPSVAYAEDWHSARVIEHPDRVAAVSLSFGLLAARGLGPAASVELLRDLVKNTYGR
jgi:transcriptional regulator with XRE-family HTH domain